MSNITFEQEELAVLTELDDEKMVALVGGGKRWEIPKWEIPKWEIPKWKIPAPPHPPSEKPCDLVSIDLSIHIKV
ncbi:MAG: hypothetical protein RMY34_34340 [Aulosira sp. DedQUE10]|nr:hypothetical protein [Aulosira sp. DedQUE10]